jgi:ribonuclease HI
MRNGVGGNMLKWIKSYLFNRRARVSLNQRSSKKFLLRHGVPQGGVLSPTLFLLFINDLVSELPRGVKAALYADDLVLWCKEEHATTATYRMQEAIDKLTAWAEDWCVMINKEKSSTTLFTLSSKQKAGTVRMGDTPMTEADETTYLGVTFDKRQTWKPHLMKAEGKARRKLAMMRKLAGTTWGANEHILKTVYQGTVRPQLEYSSPTWSSTAKSNRQALDKIQNQALRIMTGATKSTPIAFMEKITGIQPLQERRDVKILLQTEKYKCLTDHPMSARVKGYTKNRIKRSSFVHEAKKLDKAYATDLTIPTTPLGQEDIIDPLQNDLSNVAVRSSVPHLQPGKQEDEHIRKSLTLAMIDDEYPREAWTHVYTDGSATRAVINGGAGIVILYPSGKRETHHAATGTHCSNYRAETLALMKAVSMIEDSTEDVNSIVFFTDAMSVLEALTNNKVPQLANALQRISTNLNVTLQWIPAHCGVAGNEDADQLAKQGAQLDQPPVQVSYKEKVTIIKSLTRPRQEADAYHLLSRAEQVIMVRLRSGHNRLNAHMHKKYRLAPSPTCPCGTEDQTAEHILQRCKRHDQERATKWPQDTTLHQKLYGDVDDLRRTTSFIEETGVIV